MRVSRPIPTSRQVRGVTLTETLITAAGVAVLLIVLSLGMQGIRTELKRQQAIALMQTLDRALLAYQQATGQWPQDAEPRAAAGNASPPAKRSKQNEGSGDRVISLLAQVPASRVLLESLPEILRPRDTTAGPTTQPWTAHVIDPWGHPLHCLTAASPMLADRQAVAANQDRPIFISAGPDGRFGYADISASADNVRSDETGDTNQ